MRKIFKIKGMHCNSCAQLIEKNLKDKVNFIRASYAKEEVEIDFNENVITEEEIERIINKEGYQIIKENKEQKIDKNKFTSIEKIIFSAIGLTLLITIVYVLYNSGIFSNFSLPNINVPELGQKTSLIILFLAGLLTGFHCISMCGGFVISYTAKNAINGYKGFKQHLVYGVSKITSYAIIGGIFGLIGGIFAFSIKLRGIIAVLAGIFMVFYALSMFGFKFFKKFQFNPKFLTNTAINVNNNARGPFKAPFITGLLNGLFLACGPLQAMYLYAAGTGNFVTGATSLAVFGLGTLPIMLGFGSLATIISHKTTGKILKVSAILVLILGLIMLNRGLSLTGSNFNFDSVKNNILNIHGNNLSPSSINVNNGIQKINMNVSASGYSPNSFVLKKGVTVKWIINVKQLTSCNNELIMGEYNIDKKLQKGVNIIEFTPTKTGAISFTCGMGMLQGNFIVSENGTVDQQQIQKSTIKSSGSCSMNISKEGCSCRK